jgi:hypothetical protein
MAFRGGHSYNHLRAGQPYGPRRCGGPEHSAGYFKFIAEYASRYARPRARLSFGEPASRRQIKSRPARLVNPRTRQIAIGFLASGA